MLEATRQNLLKEQDFDEGSRARNKDRNPKTRGAPIRTFNGSGKMPEHYAGGNRKSRTTLAYRLQKSGAEHRKLTAQDVLDKITRRILAVKD